MAASAASMWVERLRMEPLPGCVDGASTSEAATPFASAGDGAATAPLEFNVASLNVLAESYLTPRSHPGLPESYADVAFDPAKRRKLLLDTLGRFCGPSSDSDREGDNWDILALQELDMLHPDDPILPAFDSWGYGVVRTPGDQRKDCCAIAYDRSKFALVRSETVLFDDLATLQENVDSDEKGSTNGTKKEGYGRIRPNKKPNSPSELTGMVRSFLRRNGAVAAHLKSKETGQSLIVVSVHLYWHPGYEYVKLCQAKYLLDRVAAFAASGKDGPDKSDTIPTIICGDTNSKPGSIVHRLFLRPHVDARTVAPWRYVWDRGSEEMYTEDADAETGPADGDRRDGQDEIANGDDLEKKAEGGHMIRGLSTDFTSYCRVANSTDDAKEVVAQTNGNVAAESGDSVPKRRAMYCGMASSGTDSSAGESDGNDVDLEETLELRRLKGHITPQDYQHSTPPLPVKYQLDYTLNKFTRWLRILGIDATLETAEEENERTSGASIALFDHCKNEQRTLLTTSYKLLLRKDCPPGAYLLDPKSSADLEMALPRLLRTHGVELSPCTFLTRCVVCNGNIHPVTTDEEKRAIFLEHGAPGLVDSEETIEVFRCDKCRQGYWWDDRPSSSASRVFSQATKLLRLCLRGGVGLKNETVADEKKRKVVMGAFDFVDVAKERQSEGSTPKGAETELTVIEWLREEKLGNPFRLRSAYAAQDSLTRESLPFTNVTKEFVGCLDYVFYESSQFDQVGRLRVPTSFRDMNPGGLAHGHLLPSDIWPSDHVAVGARLRLKQSPSGEAPGKNEEKQNGVVEKPAAHPPKCACGCVPQILSLFEMAELRKKAREKKAAESAARISN